MTNQRVALITGGNRGIGLETAKQLGEQGVIVVLAARRLPDATDAAELLTSTGIDARCIQLDVTSSQDRQAAADYLAANFGKLDILINNAGVAPKETLFVSKTTETSQVLFCDRPPDKRIVAAYQEEPCRPNRQPIEHPRFTDRARATG